MRGRVLMALVCVVLAGCSGSDGDVAAPGSDTEVAASSTGPNAATTSAPVATSTAVSTTSTSTTTSTTSPPAAVADARSIEDSVDVRAGASATFAALDAPQPVAVGDVVRTDATGFAEIAYFDGSMTRLDIDTEFEVVELIDAVDESVVRTRMGIGRTWHRVAELGEAGEFSVETSVATAVVQGTAFMVHCPTADVCTFMVVEGALRIDLPDGRSIDLVAPAALTVDREGPRDVVPVPFDGAFTDAWLFDNAGRDVDGGFEAAAVVYQRHGPTYGSITGTFAGTRTVTDATCAGPACPPEEFPVGHVGDRTYTFAIDCSAGVPCVGEIETDYVESSVLTQAVLPIEFDGTSFRWVLEYSQPWCTFDDGTRTGNLDTTIEWTMTPVAAEILDDQWIVTEMTGVGSSYNIVTDAGGCDPTWVETTQAATFAVTRAA